MNDIFSLPPYSVLTQQKDTILLPELRKLTDYHAQHCAAYRSLLSAMGVFPESIATIEGIPFLPAALFKEYALMSISPESIVKTLTSSGTTGQKPSKIYLDKETAYHQTRALSRIVQDFIGPKRLPMVFIESREIIKNRQEYTARGAGVLGLSNFGRDHFYALDETMKLDMEGLIAFQKRHAHEPILFFGFTFMVWEFFVQVLKNCKKSLDFSSSILLHSGGWKKLEAQSVDNTTFKQAVTEVSGITRIHNFYGLVEQVGAIFMECEKGVLHVSNFSDLLIRDYRDWSVLEIGQSGVIEVLSLLPKSYPGHAVLTEDIGFLRGMDDCLCGRKGKYFTIIGRAPKAEDRGCSDTYE